MKTLWRHGAAPLLLVCGLLLCVLCYLPGLDGPLLLDDEPQLRVPLQELDAGNWHTLVPQFIRSDSGPSGRLVSMTSLLATIVAHGPEVWWLKWDNLQLHLLCGVLLVAWLLSLQAALRQPQRALPAVLLGLVWLLHPFLLSTVLYAVQRMTVLAALFTLAGLLTYTHGRGRLGQGDGRGWWLIATCGLVCLPLAVLSKENGLLLLPLCAAVEWTVFASSPDHTPGAAGPSHTLQARRRLQGGFALLFGLPLIWVLTLGASRTWAWVQGGYAFRTFTLSERVLTEARALLYYVQAWFLPVPSVLGFFHDDFPVSRSLSSPPSTVPSVVLVVALALLACHRRLRERRPLLALGLAVFLIGHALESTLLPLELVFEHRNYLPSIGLLLVVTHLPWAAIVPPTVRWRLQGGMGALVRRRWVPRRLLAWFCRPAVLCTVLLAALAASTAQRAWVWGSPDRLFPTLYAANPGSPRLSALFASTFANAGQFPAAQEFLEGQATLGARLQSLDIACRARETLSPMRLQIVLAAVHGALTPYEVQQLVYLANDALQGQCELPKAWTLQLLSVAEVLPLARSSDHALLSLYRAHLLRAQQQPDAAQTALAQAMAQAPARERTLPQLLSAQWAVQDGRLPLARARYTEVCTGSDRLAREWQAECSKLAKQLKDSPQ